MRVRRIASVSSFNTAISEVVLRWLFVSSLRYTKLQIQHHQIWVDIGKRAFVFVVVMSVLNKKCSSACAAEKAVRQQAPMEEETLHRRSFTDSPPHIILFCCRFRSLVTRVHRRLTTSHLSLIIVIVAAVNLIIIPAHIHSRSSRDNSRITTAFSA